MPERLRIGILTPSSNTIMELRIGDLVGSLEDVSAHYGRFRVTQITMSDEALGQFTFGPQLAAAELLADAKCDMIVWGGTSGGWLGVENDEALCRAITERTGVPATTSTLATLDAFRALGAGTYALATPYLAEIQSAIVKNFADAGFDCIAEEHLEDRGNFSFAQYDEPTIGKMIRDLSAREPGAVAVFCTNFDGTRVAVEVERETGVPVIDSISVTLWHALRLLGRDTQDLAQWGKLFTLALPQESVPA